MLEKKNLLTILALLFLSFPILADDPPSGGISSGGNGSTGSPLNPNGGTKSLTQEWITVYTDNGQMWFDFADEIDGFSVNAYTTTGLSVYEYVSDSTPFNVPFTTGCGTVYITCVTTSGTTFYGQLNY